MNLLGLLKHASYSRVMIQIQVAGMKNFQPPPDYSGLIFYFEHSRINKFKDIIFIHRHSTAWETKITIQG